MAVIILLIIFILIAMWMSGLYNRLVRLRNQRQNAFADIDVQLRQRHDLVPQLVETVKGYAGHEQNVLSQVTQARSAAMNATAINDKIDKEQQLSAALKGLKISMEAYPNLKANENFLQLQEKLNDIENKLATVRRYFNSATTNYNNAVQTFPGNLVARNFGFEVEKFFDPGTELRQQMEEPPVVKF